MRMKRRHGLAMLSVCLGLGCGPKGEKLSGNGSEVENGISGIVYRPDATPVSGAVVALIPAAYNPFTDTNVVLARDTTDAQGRFAFATEPSEAYNLEAISTGLEMNALISSLNPDSVILSEPGTIRLERSRLPATDIYIPGSRFQASVDSEDFSWKSIPTGIFDLVFEGSQGALARNLPVGAKHHTRLPADIVFANRDAFLVSIEPTQNTGARKYLRLKSGGQGIILLDFDLDTASLLDTATLWMTVSEFQLNFEKYGYAASIYGFTAPWVEGTAYSLDDPDDGSTYSESAPGIPWNTGFPATSLDSASRLDVSFQGVKGGQKKHPFPVSGRILAGLKSGAYTAIAILENTAQYNNVDFSSSEGSHPPELHLYAPLTSPSSGIRK